MYIASVMKGVRNGVQLSAKSRPIYIVYAKWLLCEVCEYKRQKCLQYGRYGHIQRMCQAKRVTLVEEQSQDHIDPELGGCPPPC